MTLQDYIWDLIYNFQEAHPKLPMWINHICWWIREKCV